MSMDLYIGEILSGIGIGIVGILALPVVVAGAAVAGAVGAVATAGYGLYYAGKGIGTAIGRVSKESAEIMERRAEAKRRVSEYYAESVRKSEAESRKYSEKIRKEISKDIPATLASSVFDETRGADDVKKDADNLLRFVGIRKAAEANYESLADLYKKAKEDPKEIDEVFNAFEAKVNSEKNTTKLVKLAEEFAKKMEEAIHTFQIEEAKRGLLSEKDLFIEIQTAPVDPVGVIFNSEIIEMLHDVEDEELIQLATESEKAEAELLARTLYEMVCDSPYGEPYKEQALDLYLSIGQADPGYTSKQYFNYIKRRRRELTVLLQSIDDDEQAAKEIVAKSEFNILVDYNEYYRKVLSMDSLIKKEYEEYSIDEINDLRTETQALEKKYLAKHKLAQISLEWKKMGYSEVRTEEEQTDFTTFHRTYMVSPDSTTNLILEVTEEGTFNQQTYAISYGDEDIDKDTVLSNQKHVCHHTEEVLHQAGIDVKPEDIHRIEPDPNQIAIISSEEVVGDSGVTLEKPRREEAKKPKAKVVGA